MAEQRYFTDSKSWAGPDIHEAQPVEKGDPELLEKSGTQRPISEPMSVKILTPADRRSGHEKQKSIHKENPKDVAAYYKFRRLCDDIINELNRINAFLVEDEVCDNGSEVVVEIESLLENLYGCQYGQGESLKRVVVAVQGQVNNTRWDKRHVEFLKDVAYYLRVRYLVDEASVNACYEMIKVRGLDPFRGTLREPHIVKRYRIEEVVEP